jgi:hypothetical protein
MAFDPFEDLRLILPLLVALLPVPPVFQGILNLIITFSSAF